MVKTGERRLGRNKTEKLDERWESDTSEQRGEEGFFRRSECDIG